MESMDKDFHVKTTAAYHKKSVAEETKQQVWSFLMMLVLTGASFFAVASELIPASFALPFIVVLAVIQVFLQLFVFMHLSQKGHGHAISFMASGILAAILTVAGLVFLIWWS